MAGRATFTTVLSSMTMASAKHMVRRTMTFSRALSPSNPNTATRLPPRRRTDLTPPPDAILKGTKRTKDLFPRADLRADEPLAGGGLLIGEGFGGRGRGRCDRTIGERLQAAPARVGDPLVDRAAVGAHDFLHGHAGGIGRSGAADKPAAT